MLGSDAKLLRDQERLRPSVGCIHAALVPSESSHGGLNFATPLLRRREINSGAAAQLSPGMGDCSFICLCLGWPPGFLTMVGVLPVPLFLGNMYEETNYTVHTYNGSPKCVANAFSRKQSELCSLHRAAYLP